MNKNKVKKGDFDKMKKFKLFLILALTLMLSCAVVACTGGSDEEHEFEGLVFEGAEYTYDGTPKTLAPLKGAPITAKVTYSDSLEKTDAGDYKITATVSKSGYKTKTITATLKIKKATYDMSGVSFPNGSEVYDETNHSLEIVGKLPEGVSVSYSPASIKFVGEHIITAKFSHNNPNYEEIPDKKAILTIIDPSTETVRVKFEFSEYDTSSVKSGSKVIAGTNIDLFAGNTAYNFTGWSLGAPLSEGGTLLSSDRDFVFAITSDLIADATGMLTVYSNYLSPNILMYDPNGGEVNTESTNMKATEYYTASYSNGIVTVDISDKYLSFAESASSFWDDGTFYRDGYVLLEYNTKPDGTGEPYSIGSKFYTGSTSEQTLYCIWAEAAPASDFEYTDVHWSYASNVNADKAPHWKEDGLKITKYNGNSEFVVIPEMINGKYVTTIDTGAFINKNVKTLVFSKYIIRVDDGAFQGCDKLETLYMNDTMFVMSDAAFDAATYTNFKNFYLSARMAPRLMKDGHGSSGVFSVKFSRLLASQDKNRIIVVSGSSTYQGLGSAYLEGLFDGEYTVINLGTTRTGTGMLFFEALRHYTHDGDIVIYAPENHVNMFGQNTLWNRSFMDTEGMYNIFRYIDISHYPSVFSAFTTYNKEKRFASKTVPTAYEDIANGANRSDKYGDFQQAERNNYRDDCPTKYTDSYFITLNKYYKNDLSWDDVDYQTANKDYLTSPTWEDFTIYKDEVNRAIALIQATGAKVYFGFAPTDADDIVPEAQNREWMEAYDKLISDNYIFDGNLGSSADYVFNHQYFFDCAYHVNNYGRTWRTYQMYLDLCEILGIEDVKAVDGAGTNYDGCLFEEASDGTPVYKVDYLN